MSRPVKVLYEDNHLLVIDKPAGLATMGAAEGEPSVVVDAKAYLKAKYAKPGNVYLGVVSRLDAVVTGVLVLARTSKAAARLAEQFRTGDVIKQYLAVVDGVPPGDAGRLVDTVAKSERERRMRVVDGSGLRAIQARLRYRVLRRWAGRSLLEVRLETGRKHQIRLQLSHAGLPICGDQKYGSEAHFSPGIALHAYRLVVAHPTRDESLSFVSPIPRAWRKLGVQPPIDVPAPAD